MSNQFYIPTRTDLEADRADREEQRQQREARIHAALSDAEAIEEEMEALQRDSVAADRAAEVLAPSGIDPKEFGYTPPKRADAVAYDPAQNGFPDIDSIGAERKRIAGRYAELDVKLKPKVKALQVLCKEIGMNFGPNQRVRGMRATLKAYGCRIPERR